MVLIIDDDVSMGASLERLLRYAGLAAVTVPTGLEALSLLSIRKPALLLVDLHLPGGMDGIMIVRAVRSDPAFNNMPIWMYTNEVSMEKLREAKNSGAQEYFVKGTIGWDALVQRIAKVVKQDANS